MLQQESDESKEDSITPVMAIKDDPKAAPKHDEPTADIFKHTFVDIPDAAHQDGSEKEVMQPKQKEVFYFYNFSFDLPSEYYLQLGDFNAVSVS